MMDHTGESLNDEALARKSLNALFLENFEEKINAMEGHQFEDSILGGDIYDVPQYPIQDIEQKKKLIKQMTSVISASSFKHQHEIDKTDEVYKPRMIRLPSIVNELKEEPVARDQTDFMRVAISGEDSSGVPIMDLKIGSEAMIKALLIRAKYMAACQHTFPETTARFLRTMSDVVPDYILAKPKESYSESDFSSDHSMLSTKDPFDCDFPAATDYTFKLKDGVYKVIDKSGKRKEFLPFTLGEFLADQNKLFAFVANGPIKSFCYRRLNYLSSKHDLHILLNELQESAMQKQVPHRDFYNVRKVDTHVHASSAMSQKQLLQFIKKKKVPTATLR